MKLSLIAPCGMDCGICYAHLREKNSCPGCRLFNADEPISIASCKIRNCELVKAGKVKYCFECSNYPCKRLKALDKRYRTKYNMSEIENLEFIKENGIRKFVRNEKARWTCPECGGTICVHKGSCSSCGKKK
ncbi:hypothetical protein J2755_001402 [Methanohalophilus levihalophilus]|uniref:DUF3795 domain-containing protein n=1 Tax=Methanohalophilus levihalophilus TaxID=1431282 RepID=UPI001FD9C1AC|nr:DUF3795 domain-containing protein [Methanohalophilus levihalophilus]MBP2030468.1 hypothetical protein [Methanohalophilus levihalophilus]